MFRIGQGFDAHAFGSGNHVVLGGVRIPHTNGISAHSDGDVLCHAVGEALRTLPKGSVFLAATPQMFRYSVLHKALSEAIESGTEVGDEAEAVELAGYTVRLIESDCPNPKLTHPKDLEWMKTLLRPSGN